MSKTKGQPVAKGKAQAKGGAKRVAPAKPDAQAAEAAKAKADAQMHKAKLRACDGLAGLMDLVYAGHGEAVKEMQRTLLSYVYEFGEYCGEGTPTMVSIARKTTMWPGVLSCDAETTSANADFVQRLHLGRDSGLNYSGKKWSARTPATGAALRAWAQMKEDWQAWQNREQNAARLKATYERINARLGRPADYRPPLRPPTNERTDPAYLRVQEKGAEELRLRRKGAEMVKTLTPLNRTNYKQWAKAGRPYFLASYGEDFEKHKVFADYWANESYLEGDPTQPGKRRLVSTARGEIRKAILKQFELAFRSLAPK